MEHQRSRPGRSRLGLLLAVALLVACAPSRGASSQPRRAPSAAAPCGDGSPLTARFYDVGQALAALVELPDGRRILVDAGEAPGRVGCGAPCKAWSEHLLGALDADLPDRRIDMLWVTHQHSDHLGNAPEVLRRFDVAFYADNGAVVDRPMPRAAREAAVERGTTIVEIGPDRRAIPIAGSAGVRLRAVVPERWPGRCDRHPNDCSIGLRIDYCASSLLFVGDAEKKEEAQLDTHGPVTLLQVGHHGSDTSSSAGFLAQAAPRYAVVSSGKPDTGTNGGHCHPRRSVLAALTKQLGGGPTRGVEAFEGPACERGAEGWASIEASERIFVTARDGDVVLRTKGDGVFVRVP